MLSTTTTVTTTAGSFFTIRPISVTVVGCLLLLIAVGLGGTILWDWMKRRKEKKQQLFREQANVEVAFSHKEIGGKNIYGVLWGGDDAGSSRKLPKEEKQPLMSNRSESKSSKRTETAKSTKSDD